MSEKILILIDFDNVFKKSIGDYNHLEFELIIKDIIRDVLAINKHPEEINIRFYGGWYKDDILSSKASVLQQLISLISIFPIIKEKTKIKGSLDLATSMYFFPEHIWTNTYKEKEGIPKIRINHEVLSDNCNSNKETCPAHLLNRFTSRKEKQCQNQFCDITNARVFKGIEQKMVDTIIACDLISFSQDEAIGTVCLFSDDIDLLPPLGFSSVFKSKNNPKLQIQLFMKNQRKIDLTKQILRPFDINILLYE